MSFDQDFASAAAWACAYRALRLNVIPASVEKHPVALWGEFQDNLTPDAVFARWYSDEGEHRASYSMGFLTGSGCLEPGLSLLVIDVDAKEKDGRETWAQWLQVHANGLEPDTWKARTGSGGRHIYFSYPSHLHIHNTQDKFHGIDTRAQGGFIMAPPSPHEIRGTSYEWEQGCNPLVDDVDLAPAPAWLVEIAQDIGSAGSPAAPRGERTEATTSTDPWGKRTDGREVYMRDMVWAAVVDLRRANPVQPDRDTALAKMRETYEHYARRVRTRFPGEANEIGLEREGRGLSLFQVKWDVAMRQWNTKVAAAALVPRPLDAADLKPIDPPAVVFDTALPSGKPRLELIQWDDLPELAVTWLIKDFLPAGGMAALYGKPGSYKSFMALYLAAAVATGADAFGRATTQGDVIYIAGEGGSGLKKRRDAFDKHYGLAPGTRVFFLRSQLNLRSTMDDAKALVDAVRAISLKPALVIVDTLARAFAGGNENASEDMGAFIVVIGHLQAALDGAAVLLVHHSGKDEARGMRGHSSLYGAVDTELEVVKLSADDAKHRTGKMTVTKQKDGEDGYALAYRLDFVSLGRVDPTEGSLVVVPDDAAQAGQPRAMSPENKRVLAALEAVLGEAGTPVGLDRVPRGAKCVRLALWRETYLAQAVGERASKERVFRRSAKYLQEAGLVGHHADYCWLTDD
jgi:hypothetical protein